MNSALSLTFRNGVDRSFQMEDTTAWYAKRHMHGQFWLLL